MLFVALVCSSSCHSTGPRKVTIAFPNGKYSSIAAIMQFKDILERDQERLIWDLEVKGLPVPEIVIALDSAQLAVHDVSVGRVKSAIQSVTLRSLNWKPSKDSLRLVLPEADLASDLTINDLERLIVGGLHRQSPIFLKDLATITRQEDPSGIVVNGQSCVVIEGRTESDEEAISAWLRGLDRALGVEYFIVIEQ